MISKDQTNSEMNSDEWPGLKSPLPPGKPLLNTAQSKSHHSLAAPHGRFCDLSLLFTAL